MKKHRTGRVSLPTIAAALGLAFIFALAQEAAAEKPLEKAAVGTFTDIRDKKTYKTVKIGSQVWMAENLNIDLLSSKCYENKPDNCKQYGRLYDWKTAMKACPGGWYLPSEADWGDLMQFANPSCSLISDCADAGAKLKAANGWNGDGNGTDNYGFAALPGGVGLSGSKFRDAGNGGLWWSSSDDGKKAPRISIDGPNVHRNSSDKNLLLSIRCLQGEPAQMEGSFTDPRDKKKYKTIKIGKQTWMAENLNYQPKPGNSWCYKNDEANCEKYGRLYDRKAAKDACPSGWHLSSRDEWDSLAHAIGGKSDRSNDGGNIAWRGAGLNLRSKSGWKKDVGVDGFGFSALPGGRFYNLTTFEKSGDEGYWWTATDRLNDCTYYRFMYDVWDWVYEGCYGDKEGYSVRCVQD